MSEDAYLAARQARELELIEKDLGRKIAAGGVAGALALGGGAAAKHGDDIARGIGTAKDRIQHSVQLASEAPAHVKSATGPKIYDAANFDQWRKAGKPKTLDTRSVEYQVKPKPKKQKLGGLYSSSGAFPQHPVTGYRGPPGFG